MQRLQATEPTAQLTTTCQLKPNSITLAGSKADRFEAKFHYFVRSWSVTSFELDSVMECGCEPAS